MDLDKYPVLDPFAEYMQSNWQGNLDLDQLNWLVDFTDEETLFSAFILAFSGAWDEAEVAENVANAAVNQGVSVDSISNNQSDIAHDVSESLKEANANHSRDDFIHSHRQVSLLFEFGYDWGDIARTAVTEWLDFLQANGYQRGKEWLNDGREADCDTFYWMFNSVDVDTFARLADFDFLELAYRAGGIPDLYPPPEEARRAYIKDDDPKDGFMMVFCSDEATIEAAEKARENGWRDAKRQLDRDIQGIDELLQDTATHLVDRGWSEDTVIFDMESCFCLFSKNNDYQDVLSNGVTQ